MEEWKTIPILVFANKQDLELALSAKEIASSLKFLEDKKRIWSIQAWSAIKK